ncbi:hypothetical protein PICST_28763 [Scheffersomyces stipitis CBS 6054]|uniref:ER membrane protein complex subunit 10 n=1 Tax=Scheffersomyces stipitis (strain ATCC 58785 / CBS 6054 / NBRC 10063 / NRRL Y-11545) TaxID=322104 RepID=A3GGW4_PICST|nr:predicted protein [Scheffersomyces stipitis CBS 6054]EAZ63601.1 hypothetical protein PICST_28763 [Scheffersomyces stipitis CBS 6054]
MNWFNSVLLVLGLWIQFALAQDLQQNLQRISVYTKEVKSHSIKPYGTLVYNKSNKRGQFEKADTDISIDESQDVCLGTDDLAEHGCFSFLSNGADAGGLDYHVYLDGSGEINHISVSNNVKQNSSVVVHPVVEAPAPNLNPESRKNAPKQNQQQGPRKEVVVKKKKVVNVDDEGNEVVEEVEEEVEVEIDDRSWIQKNWFYIALPLVFFLLMGEEKKE